MCDPALPTGPVHVKIFYVSPALIAPHHGKVDLDGRPRDVGVFEEVDNNYSKKRIYWGGTKLVSYPQSGCTQSTRYTHLGDKVEGGIKTIHGMAVYLTGNPREDGPVGTQ